MMSSQLLLQLLWFTASALSVPQLLYDGCATQLLLLLLLLSLRVPILLSVLSAPRPSLPTAATTTRATVLYLRLAVRCLSAHHKELRLQDS